jgi:hypothetical protein
VVVVIVTCVVVFHYLNWATSNFVSKLLQVEISEFIDFEVRVAKILFVEVRNQLHVLLENLVSRCVLVISCVIPIVCLYELQELIMHVRGDNWNDKKEE